MRRMTMFFASSAICLLGFAGCGGGGGSAPAPPQKTATITFSTVSGAHTAPLEGIQLTTTLPAGARIFKNITSALKGQNDTGQIGGRLYVHPNVSFVVTPTDLTIPIKFGTFARLTCDVEPGFTLSQNSFSVSDIQMTGTDASGNSVNLVPQIPVMLSVSFGF